MFQSPHLSPIVLFVYNRPSHTRATLESLSQNFLADKSTLFIFCDGPKEDISADEQSKIDQVRTIAKERNWCQSVKVIERKSNLGLADSIVKGVTQVLKDFDRVIVLEDDLVLSKSFLRYMNDALTIYEDSSKVMHISGYSQQITLPKTPSTYFLYVPDCWGWATWRRAWEHFIDDAELLYHKIRENESEVDLFNYYGNYDHLQTLKENANRTRKTWAVKWYASTFLHKGLALHPYKSLVRNIGHDNSGENCNGNYWSKKYAKQSIVDHLTVSYQTPELSQSHMSKIALFLGSFGKSTLKTRLDDRFSKILEIFK